MRILSFRALRSIFLATSLLSGAVAATDTHAYASLGTAADAKPREDRSLSFKIARDVGPDGKVEYVDDRVHTFSYYRNGAYDAESLKGMSALLRDREKDVGPPKGIDPALMDLLFDMKTVIAARHPGLDVVFHVISGYRSPATNEALRTDPNNPYRGGVGKESMHTRAKAIDIFIPEVPGEELRDIAWHLQKGGVGWYPQFKDTFPYRYIHVDTGRVRHWGFQP